MRGYASGSLLDPNFFIVMDRLYEILNVKIQKWSKLEQGHRGGALSEILGRQSSAGLLRLQQLLIERLTVAYDLSAAFWYMHQNKYVM